MAEHLNGKELLPDSSSIVLGIVEKIPGDDRVFELPVGYSQRVHDFLDRSWSEDLAPGLLQRGCDAFAFVSLQLLTRHQGWPRNHWSL